MTRRRPASGLARSVAPPALASIFDIVNEWVAAEISALLEARIGNAGARSRNPSRIGLQSRMIPWCFWPANFPGFGPGPHWSPL